MRHYNIFISVTVTQVIVTLRSNDAQCPPMHISHLLSVSVNLPVLSFRQGLSAPFMKKVLDYWIFIWVVPLQVIYRERIGRTGLVQHSAHRGSSHGAQRRMSPPVISALSINYSSNRRGGIFYLPWRLPVEITTITTQSVLNDVYENQVFSPSYDSAPPPHPLPLLRE